jgi:hypothetical protein
MSTQRMATMLPQRTRKDLADFNRFYKYSKAPISGFLLLFRDIAKHSGTIVVVRKTDLE